RADGRRVDQGTRPIDLVGPMQVREEQSMHLRPDARSLPVPEPAPAGHARATAHLLGQHLPGNAAAQDKEDAGQTCAGRQGLAPRSAKSAPLDRDEGFDDVPQFVIQQGFGHDRASLHDQLFRTSHAVLLGALRARCYSASRRSRSRLSASRWWGTTVPWWRRAARALWTPRTGPGASTRPSRWPWTIGSAGLSGLSPTGCLRPLPTRSQTAG